ncbi:MAG: FRG domain-containing protein [Alphaproteobacteria bacterium]|nr:MAG: FRG domain-containing protein [Alphaproteobacteria bacterium]
MAQWPDPINALDDLFKLLRQTPPDEDQIHLYRGHRNSSWKLEPSLFRYQEYRQAEREILRDVIALQPNEFRDDTTTFERLVRLQHYGAPTRLFDLSYNPLVGLFFACRPPTKEGEAESEGEFFQFTLKKADVKYFDSDTISCVSNLASLRYDEKQKLMSFRDNGELNSRDEGRRLLFFIQAEKPFFEPRIVLEHLKSIFAVHPKLSNQRIVAQQGAFLIFGETTELDRERALGINVLTAKIPASMKKCLRRELDRISINLRSMYPEIEKASEYVKSKLLPPS